MAMFAAPAFAQNQNQNCGNYGEVVNRLADGYGETRRSRGLASPTQAVEMFANDDTGTWTLLTSTPTGRACVVGSGRFYEEFDDALPPPGDAS